MILVRYAMIHPLLGKELTTYPLSHTNFFILVLSIVFITAAGYVINDYFDIRIDRINRPDKLILGKSITFSQAQTVHQVLSAIGIILGFYAAYKAGSFRIGGVQAIMVAVMWYYSYRYKGLFIWGNLVVSILSGMIILIVWLFEFYSLQLDTLAFGSAIPRFSIINKFIFSYFIFSILLSFSREIIKDVIDIPGDSRYGCQTLAVKTGKKIALRVAAAFQLLILLIIIVLQIFILPFLSKPLLIYSIFLLDLPLAWIIFKTLKAKETTDIQKLSSLIKVVMLLGIISMVFITL